MAEPTWITTYAALKRSSSRANATDRADGGQAILHLRERPIEQSLRRPRGSLSELEASLREAAHDAPALVLLLGGE